jgi:hypothetical protein
VRRGPSGPLLRVVSRDAFGPQIERRRVELRPSPAGGRQCSAVGFGTERAPQVELVAVERSFRIRFALGVAVRFALGIVVSLRLVAPLELTIPLRGPIGHAARAGGASSGLVPPIRSPLRSTPIRCPS